MKRFMCVLSNNEDMDNQVSEVGTIGEWRLKARDWAWNESLIGVTVALNQIEDNVVPRFIEDLWGLELREIIPNKVCARCGGEVTTSDIEGYSAYCLHHDEDLYEMELEEVSE